ncbi:MAG: fibrinogen-like YCDxxxxGGGW domain-containing protein, partial [Polyangiaceae bacterium]
NCIGVLNSCNELFDIGVNTSGMYNIDVDGAGPLKAKQVYCDMVNQGGGWTECVKVVNTAGEDLPCNVAGWLDSCVDATMATWSGNEVMVALYTANTTTYAAFGSRNNAWTYDNLTSTNGASSQYNRSNQHINAITLSDNRILTISGKNAGSSGWGGSWGNGYVLAAQTTPSYASNNVLAVMSFKNSGYSSPCGARSFVGMDAGHEVMYSSVGAVSTNGNASLTNAYKYLSTFRFLVR